MQKNTNTGKVISVCVTLGAIALALYATGIGCPIKFLTGLSCPGCGMTRAWIYALTLRPALAFAYHPLFWLVPALVALVVAKDKIGRRVFYAVATVSLVAILGVWITRLASPCDTNMLSLSDTCEDVVSFEAPAWLVALQS